MKGKKRYPDVFHCVLRLKLTVLFKERVAHSTADIYLLGALSAKLMESKRVTLTVNRPADGARFFIIFSAPRLALFYFVLARKRRKHSPEIASISKRARAVLISLRCTLSISFASVSLESEYAFHE